MTSEATYQIDIESACVPIHCPLVPPIWAGAMPILVFCLISEEHRFPNFEVCGHVEWALCLILGKRIDIISRYTLFDSIWQHA